MNNTKILFVCLGNICRSPLANEVFLHLVKQQGLEEQFEIDSCGTGNWHIGSLPDSRMIREAEKHGIEMTHRARTLHEFDFEYYDLILAMDLSNLDTLLHECKKDYRHKVKLFRTYDPETDDTNAEVPDPYYDSEKGFSNVYNIVERTCKNLLQDLTK